MQDEQLSLRTQRLIEQLENLWQSEHEPSLETLRHILVNLPQQYQTIGMLAIAERLVSSLKLHFLEIIATFYQKAEQEEIDSEEREETLQDIKLETHRLMELSKHLSIRSIDDLLTLSNTTFGLYDLSQVGSAEDAQRWMYKLPMLYRNKLEQEHLIPRQTEFSVTIALWPLQAKEFSTFTMSGTTVTQIRKGEVAPSSEDSDWSHLLSKPGEISMPSVA